MTQTKRIWPSRIAKQLIPISQLITVPEGIAVPFDHLNIANLSDLSRGVTLVTFVGPAVKVLITKNAKLCVTVVTKINDDDTLAQKHGVKNVARTVSYATGLVPLNQEEAKRLPTLTSVGWKLPDEVSWRFDLPGTTTGTEVLAAVRAGNAFIIRTTETLLTPATRAREVPTQI